MLKNNGLRLNFARKVKSYAKFETREIVVYQPDQTTRLEVRIEDDTVWLTQEGLSILFGVQQPAIMMALDYVGTPL